MTTKKLSYIGLWFKENSVKAIVRIQNFDPTSRVPCEAFKTETYHLEDSPENIIDLVSNVIDQNGCEVPSEPLKFGGTI